MSGQPCGHGASISSVAACIALFLGGVAVPTFAATPGLPFTEDFSERNLRDRQHTSANWSVEEQAVFLAWSRPGETSLAHQEPGLDVGRQGYSTYALALGDVDGDGDLDLVEGRGGWNRVFSNNGTDAPLHRVESKSIVGDAHVTRSVALGDVDGDGDLDLIAGNAFAANRLYLNDGTAQPFDGASGTDIGADVDDTRSVVVGDVDGDGRLDLVVGNWGAASLLYLNDGSANPFSGEGLALETGQTTSVVLGDVDGDGDLDLVVGNNCEPNRLYLNDGTTDPFGGGVDGTDVGLDSGCTRALALGDVDGDGDLDLVVGNGLSVDRLFLNTGTAAPFAGMAGTEIWGSETTYSVALGDVDGDGDLDLVCGNHGWENTLHLNDGTTYPFNTWAELGEWLGRTTAVLLGDADGDGDLDLFLAHELDFNRYLDNDGTADPFYWWRGTDIGPRRTWTQSLAAGDVDGDGDVDLVAGNESGAHDRLYRNDGSATPFAGAEGTALTLDTQSSWRVALGDLDGDGDLDLVTSGPLRLYLNDGSPDPYVGAVGREIGLGAGSTRSIALGDVDGDGDLDLVHAGSPAAGYLLLYLNDGSADPFGGVSGTSIGAIDMDAECVGLADLDGDGDLDLVAGDASGPSRFYLNDGSADPFLAADGTAFGSDSAEARYLALGDLNGDGHVDLVTAGSVNRTYLSSGTAVPFDGTLGTPFGWNEDPATGVALGDLDGDGDLDVVVAESYGPDRLYLNDGTSEPLAGANSIEIGDETDADMATRTLLLADLDGDGDLDLAVGGAIGGIRTHENVIRSSILLDGGGSDIGSLAERTQALALGDVDGDGDLDLVMGNDGPNRLYINDGTSEPFLEPSGSDITGDAHDTRCVALGDVDDDGDLDLVTGEGSRPNRLYLNNGTAVPFQGVSGTDVTLDADDTWSVVLGDLNGDGRLDLVSGNDLAPNRLYLNAGTADPFDGVLGVDISADGHRTRSVALGDVDGDGDLDLVAGNSLDVNRLYLNDGTADPFGTALGDDIGIGAANTHSLVLGDVDGDGDLDAVVGNESEPSRLYLNAGTADPFAGVSGVNIGTDVGITTSVALADLDRDGDLDLVLGKRFSADWIHENDGTAAPFGGAAGTELVGSEATDTSSLVLGDVDGDGSVDVIEGNVLDSSRLYRNAGVMDRYDTAAGLATSLEVDARDTPIGYALLSVVETVPTNTSVDYFLSNDGGGRWFQARPGEVFAFPTLGSDLRWRADLRSLSPVLTPIVEEVDLRLSADVDGDLDGVLDEDDCAPLDPTTWAVPVVENLRLTQTGGVAGETHLLWPEPADPGSVSGDLLHDVLRSDDAADFTTPTCVESDDSDTTAVDPVPAAATGVAFYLVRAQNTACGEGSVGTGSDQLERAAGSCP